MSVFRRVWVGLIFVHGFPRCVDFSFFETITSPMLNLFLCCFRLIFHMLFSLSSTHCYSNWVYKNETTFIGAANIVHGFRYTIVLVSQCVLSSVVLILVKIGGEWFNFPVMILSALLSSFVSGCSCFFVVRSDTNGWDTQWKSGWFNTYFIFFQLFNLK